MEAGSENASIMSGKEKQMQKSLASQQDIPAEGKSASMVVNPIRKFKSK
jgi:hypothetical protein